MCAVTTVTLPEQQDTAVAQSIKSNAIVLSNIVELTTSVVRKMSSENLSETLGDQSQSRDVVANTVANRIKQKLGL